MTPTQFVTLLSPKEEHKLLGMVSTEMVQREITKNPRQMNRLARSLATQAIRRPVAFAPVSFRGLATIKYSESHEFCSVSTANIPLQFSV
jgi:hypothetical protein